MPFHSRCQESLEKELMVLRQELARANEKLERLDALLIARDPGNAASAHAYDGLRRQLATLASERRQHLVHLARISAALDAGVDKQGLSDLVVELRNDVGLQVTTDAQSTPEAFDRSSEFADPKQYSVLYPAYIAVNQDGQILVIKQGTLEGRQGDITSSSTARTTGDVTETDNQMGVSQ